MNIELHEQRLALKLFIRSYMDRKKEAKEILTELDLAFLAALLKSLK